VGLRQTSTGDRTGDVKRSGTLAKELTWYFSVQGVALTCVFMCAVRQLWPKHHGGQHAVIALAASIVVAWTIHALVEKPCMRLRKKLHPKESGIPDVPVVVSSSNSGCRWR